MYRDGIGVEQDYITAHMWLSIAGSLMRARELRRRIFEDLAALEKLMTRDQLVEAERRAGEWKPVQQP